MDFSSSSFASSSPASQSPKQRRRSAALSCAECRRLKLRCSRVFPCTSCVKKGCAAICPNDSLTTGKGNRFILANTEVLHEKINELSSRVRELEDALADAHAYQTAERHPLLSEELLMIKRPLEREAKSEQSLIPQPQPEPEPEEAIDAVYHRDGEDEFLWYDGKFLVLAAAGDEDNDFPQEDVPLLSRAFPFSLSLGETVEEVRASIFRSLPQRSTAQRLIDIYYRHAGWMYRPVEPDDLWANVFDSVYDPEALADFDPIQSHKIAVVYVMLALGALLDLEKPPYSKEASHYYHLARAALAVDSVFEEQSVPAIQALVLMCHYMFFAEINGPRWALMGLVVKLAQSAGLHRDSGRWNLDVVETKRRRSLLWEIVTYDSWQSLTYGRPPSFSMLHIDCQMAHSPTIGERGEEEMSFELWKHRFVSQCLNIVHDQAFGARTPNYRVIQDLDRKVRSFFIPPSLQVPGFGGQSVDAASPVVSITFQRYTAFAIREMSIFYMHRGFFARALEENPEDPLSNKFSPSVLAAHNSACSFVGLIQSLFAQHPRLSERLWFLFTHVFSCAIVLGSIAIKCPGIALARSAISHLEAATRLFEAVTTGRANKVIPVLHKLRERAATAMQEALSNHSLTPPRSTPERERDAKRDDEELATLGGKTRLVPRKSTAGSVPSSPASNPGSTASPISSPLTATPLPATAYPSSGMQDSQATYGQISHPVQPPGHSHTQYSTLPPLMSQQMVQSPVETTTQWPGYSHMAVSPVAPAAYHQAGPVHGVDGFSNMMDYTPYTLPPEPWQNVPPLDLNYHSTSQSSGQGGTLYDQYSPSGFDMGASLRPSQYLVGSNAPPMHTPSPVMNEVGSTGDPSAAWHTLVSQFSRA